jgi:hypothetical protein
MLVQQTARLVHRVILKLDIVRALDSVSWGLLFEVLCKMGFGPRFCDWDAILLSMANSQWQASPLPLPPYLAPAGFQTREPLVADVIHVGDQHA